jgi:hypothetical protein
MMTGMIEALKRLARFLSGGHWWWGVVMSLVLFAGSMVLVTFIVIGWPTDHFRRSGRLPFWGHHHPVVRVTGLILKNLAGAVLVALGIIMALPGVPGQGLLTALIGLTLLNFPGKTELERKLISRPSVLKAINGWRARFHRPPLELD